MKLPPKRDMRQGLQVAGEPMKHITWALAGVALAISISGCGRFGRHVPEAAVQACGAPKALLAVRRALFRQAMEQGTPAVLISRLKREGHASLEDPEVQEFDRHTGIVTCRALFRLQPPAQGAQEISSSVAYTGQPLRAGGWRYRLTEPGQVVQAIASLGPLPAAPAPPASATAADAASQVPSSAELDAETLQDAAAAGDTGRSHRPDLKPPQPGPKTPQPAPAAPPAN
jgi:hypothetical protein